MTAVQSPYKCVLICTIITIQTGSKESRAPCCVSLFHRRQFSSRARTGSSPFIDRARRLHTTQSPSLSVCGSLVCILLVPLRAGHPTRKLPVLVCFPRSWSCLCLHFTADSPCSCTAESKDCRARSFHVGDRYPFASRRSWCSTSSRMSVPRPLLLFSPLIGLKWLYTRPRYTSAPKRGSESVGVFFKKKTDIRGFLSPGSEHSR